LDVARVLVLNAGSSSLKASIVEPGLREPLATAAVDWGSDATKAADRRKTVAVAIERLTATAGAAAKPDAVGHRVVHGGLRFREPIVMEDAVLAALDELSEMAPLHNPVAVDTIRAARDLLPRIPHVAVFDTAFHATLPRAAYVYPLPWRWHEEWGIRRFGFHGLSAEWSVRRAAELLARDQADLGLVVAHLGSGCSVTAIDGGRSVATSMGMTPLEGLMMATRAGSFDPGVMLKLLDDRRLDLDELSSALEHESGLVGVAGVDGGMREVAQAAAGGSDRAALAIEMFCLRATEGVAAAATSLQRLDAIVFTGGIGENDAGIRARIVRRLASVGVGQIRAESVTEDSVLSAPGSAIAILRIEAREDLMIAEAVASLVD
jgi:acetate kinase